MKLIKLFVLAFSVLLATANLAFSQTTTNQTIDSLKTVTIKVKGITCSSDLFMISTNVEKVKGVSRCEAKNQGATTTFEVKYNPMWVNKEEISEAIKNTSSCENPDEKPYTIKQ